MSAPKTAVESEQQAIQERFKSREFEVGDIVKHFKREVLSQTGQRLLTQYIYEIIAPSAQLCDAFDSEYVVYRALYPPYQTFIREKGQFLSKVDKEKYPGIKQYYRFEKLQLEDESDIDCSDILVSMYRPEVIVQAKYLMDDVGPHGEQSTLKCTLRDGTVRYFYYNKDNPMPRRYIIEGKTWPELCGLMEGFWRGSVCAGDTVLFKERMMNI